MKTQNLLCTQYQNKKFSLFRNFLNKLLRSQENAEKVPNAYLSKKADSPRNFSGKFSNLVGILLWIIVILNLIITFLIYKIIF